MNVSLRLLTILVLFISCFSKVVPVFAQTGSTILFSTPELDSFPNIWFHMDTFEPDGSFINDLQPADIMVMENGQAITPKAVDMIDNGLQIIVALNTSPAMANNVNGVSGYLKIQQALQSWAASLPAESLDDFSLSTPTGLFLIRARDPGKFVQAITDYQPDLQKNQPSLNSLSEALDLATDTLGRPLLKRTILFITPPLPTSNISTLPDLAVRAQEIGVKVNIWMIGKPENISDSAPDPVRQFAESTGGKYYQIVSTEALPQVEPTFTDLRKTYRIEYLSEIQTSGSHTLKVKVNSKTSSMLSDAVSFRLDVEPPNPIFLSPPAQIRRTWAVPTDNQAASVLNPDEVSLQIVVEFPDGRIRDLQSTRLYVDDMLVAENIAMPFDRFSWAIDDITAPVSASLRVEAVDVLGLSGSSIEIPVEILIDQPAKNQLTDRISDSGMIAIAGVTVSGVVLTLILVFTGTQRRALWKRQQNTKKLRKDPLTQPVQVNPVAPRKERSFFGKKKSSDDGSIAFWPRPSVPNAPARLVALDENEQPITGGGMPLSRHEITFGSDPKRATQVLNSTTVDSLHARLYRSEEGDFFLADHNTIAGTWINYAPVASTGARLEHGDLIHIGKVMFRFELTDLTQVATAEVQVVELEQIKP